MKKWVILAAILLALMPERGTELGKLLPVETLLIEKEKERYVVSADTGEQAEGESLAAAMAGLQRGAPGVLFLDTADYVLVSRTALDCVAELSDYVRPGTRIYQTVGKPELSEIGAFLRTHGPDAPLFRVKKRTEQLPVLDGEGENFYFEGQ